MNPDQSSSRDNLTSSDVEEAALFDQAAAAEQGEMWDQAISAYNSILKKKSGTIRLHMSLGKAYERKSKVSGEQAFMLLAMEQYRLALKLDPQFMDANEALISAAYRADALEDLMAEYKLRYKADPDNPLYKDFMRKAQIFLSMPRKRADERRIPVGSFAYTLIGRIMPAAAMISLLVSLFLAMKPHSVMSSISHISLRIALGLFVIYIVCWFAILRP